MLGVRIMQEEVTVQLFEWIDDTTKEVMDAVGEPYLESLGITLELMFHGDVQTENKAVQSIAETAITTYQWTDLDHQSMAKGIQFALLKGMKESTQAQHMMTPEAIALFVGYLASKFVGDKEIIRLFDPAGGTGNLLFQVMDQLDNELQAYASEIDPTLLKLALEGANLQEKQVEFFHQDSIEPFLLDPVDLVVSDLPVGYYPNDVRAANFAVHADEGHTYAHHLFIEQSMTYVRENGIGIFLVPESLFDSEQADKLQTYMQANVQIVGVLQLPETSFAHEAHRKSIVILRKKTEESLPIKQPLLAMLPSFNDASRMEDIIIKINQWFETVYE